MNTYTLHTIHADNGSEFHALLDQAVQEITLTHLWSPARTPKVHSHIERFNGVIQDEFINYHYDEAVVDQIQILKRLTNWLIWYNKERPHHALGFMAPNQYLLDLLKGAESLESL